MSIKLPNNAPKMPSAAQEAAQWLVKIEIDRSDNGDDYVEFMDWLQLSPENEQHYEQCLRTWKMSEGLADNPDISAIANGKGTMASGTSLPRSRRPLTLLALCASVLVTVSIGLAMLLQPAAPVIYQTATGEQRRIDLEDGSSVILNTATKIAIAYSSTTRQISLEQGEALFDVTKDPERPFVVEVGRSRVEVLGTLFNIRKQPGQIAVTLAEGKVRLSQIDSGSEEAYLSPGEKAIVHPSGTIDQKQATDVKRVTEWTSGKLSFVDVVLEDVVKEVNRYSSTKLYIIDPSIKEEKINAYFYVENIDSLLFALENSFNIKSQKDTGGIYLSRIR